MVNKNWLNLLCLVSGVGIALASGLTSEAFAQSGLDNQGQQSNERNGIYGDAPEGLDPLDIIHRAQQLNGRTPEEFNEESQAQLDNSASDFKRLQQQRILEQQQSGTTLEAEVIETGE